MKARMVLNELLDPVSRCLDAESARRLIKLKLDPKVQARMEILAERSTEGLLTDDERYEYEALIDATDLISILKLKARRQLTPAA